MAWLVSFRRYTAASHWSPSTKQVGHTQFFFSLLLISCNKAGANFAAAAATVRQLSTSLQTRITPLSKYVTGKNAFSDREPIKLGEFDEYRTCARRGIRQDHIPGAIN